jgi:hypothetical protein
VLALVAQDTELINKKSLILRKEEKEDIPRSVTR